MKGNKTIFFIKHCYPLERDPRLIKLVEATKEGGYLPKLLLWDHREELHEYKYSTYAKSWEEIVFRLKSFYGIKSLAYWPIWWLFVLLKLIRLEWDIAYVIDLPSALPVLVAGKLRSRPIIYEIENTFIDQVIVPKIIRSFFLAIERSIANLFDAIVLVDELQIQELGFSTTLKITVIYDSAPDAPKEFKEYSSLIQPSGTFTLFYAGMLHKGKELNLDKLIEAIRDIESIKVIIAGHGDLVGQIKKWSEEIPNKVEFIGRISYQEVLLRSLGCDLLFVLRDPRLPINRYICGSKLFQAMMCSKPLLVSKGTSTALKVTKNKIGLVVNPHNVSEIKEAILKLKTNPELCRKLGANSRRAYESEYSWEIMKRRLLNLFSRILNSYKDA
jgi:glycosyltransferase involved in cell wall biosynthesis